MAHFLHIVPLSTEIYAREQVMSCRCLHVVNWMATCIRAIPFKKEGEWVEGEGLQYGDREVNTACTVICYSLNMGPVRLALNMGPVRLRSWLRKKAVSQRSTVTDYKFLALHTYPRWRTYLHRITDFVLIVTEYCPPALPDGCPRAMTIPLQPRYGSQRGNKLGGGDQIAKKYVWIVLKMGWGIKMYSK